MSEKLNISIQNFNKKLKKHIFLIKVLLSCEFHNIPNSTIKRNEVQKQRQCECFIKKNIGNLFCASYFS